MAAAATAAETGVRWRAALASAGFRLSDAGVAFVAAASDEAEAARLLLRGDLRELTESGTPEDVSRVDNLKIAGPLVLQVLSVTNLAVPSDRQNDISGPRLLSFKLTDGPRKVTALEYRPLPGVAVNTAVPGSKLRVRGVLVKRGRILLTPDTAEFLGGEAPHLTAGWRAARAVSERRSGPAWALLDVDAGDEAVEEAESDGAGGAEKDRGDKVGDSGRASGGGAASSSSSSLSSSFSSPSPSSSSSSSSPLPTSAVLPALRTSGGRPDGPPPFVSFEHRAAAEGLLRRYARGGTSDLAGAPLVAEDPAVRPHVPEAAVPLAAFATPPPSTSPSPGLSMSPARPSSAASSSTMTTTRTGGGDTGGGAGGGGAGGGGSGGDASSVAGVSAARSTAVRVTSIEEAERGGKVAVVPVTIVALELLAPPHPTIDPEPILALTAKDAAGQRRVFAASAPLRTFLFGLETNGVVIKLSEVVAKPSGEAFLHRRLSALSDRLRAKRVAFEADFRAKPWPVVKDVQSATDE